MENDENTPNLHPLVLGAVASANKFGDHLRNTLIKLVIDMAKKHQNEPDIDREIHSAIMSAFLNVSKNFLASAFTGDMAFHIEQVEGDEDGAVGITSAIAAMNARSQMQAAVCNGAKEELREFLNDKLKETIANAEKGKKAADDFLSEVLKGGH